MTFVYRFRCTETAPPFIPGDPAASLAAAGNEPIVQELIFPQLSGGETSPAQTIFLQNFTLGTINGCRLAAKLLTGVVTGTPGNPASDKVGAEVCAEKWIQARIMPGGPWTPIGGPYGPFDGAGNFLDLGNIDPAVALEIQIRIVVPASFSTIQVARCRLGVGHPSSP